MVLVYAATLWLMFGAFLVFPHLGLPRFMSRAAIFLCYGEGATLLVVDIAPEGSFTRDTAETVAGIDIPALAVLLLVLAPVAAIRQARRSPDVAVEHREHVLTAHGAEADDPPALPLGSQRRG